MNNAFDRTVKVQIEISFSEEFLSNLLVTAFDVPHGGCWYWATYRHQAFVIEGDIWRSVEIYQSEEDPAHTYIVTHETLLEGIKRLFELGVLPKRNDLRGQFAKGDDADYDASDADVIVQLGIFGEVIYG